MTYEEWKDKILELGVRRAYLESKLTRTEPEKIELGNIAEEMEKLIR